MHKKVYRQLIKGLITLPVLIGFASGVSLIATSCSSSWTYADIISINDFHGHTDQYNVESANAITAIADKYTTIKKEDIISTGSVNSTYFIMNGDNAQGTAISNLSDPKGNSTYQMLSYFNPEYSSLGNHEFDWGLGYLDPKQTETGKETFAAMGKLKAFLSCNTYKVVNDRPTSLVDWVKPYAITHINDLNVGFVGYTTYETYTTTSKTNLNGIAFADATNTKNFSDIYANVKGLPSGNEILQKAIDDCWNDTLGNGKNKPDVVLLLAHSGISFTLENGKLIPNKDSEIIKIVNNSHHLNAVLSAHTHQSYVYNYLDADNRSIPIGQGGKYGQELLQTKISYRKSDRSFKNISMNVINIGHKNNKGQIVYPTFDELTNKDNAFVGTVDRACEEWKKKLAPIMSKVRFNLTSDIVDDDDNPIVPYKPTDYKNHPGYNDDLANFSPAAMSMAAAMGYILSPDVINQVNSKTFPSEIKEAVSVIKSQGVVWSDFNGIDMSLLNIGSARSSITATSTTNHNPVNFNNATSLNLVNTSNAEATHGLTMGDIYSFQPFDNNIVLDRTTVGRVNEYINTLMIYGDVNLEKDLTDGFWLSNYKIGYKSEKFKPETKPDPSSKNYFLVDSNNKAISEDTYITVAMSDFLYMNGDYSLWSTWTNEDKNKGLNCDAYTMPTTINSSWEDDQFATFGSMRSVFFEAAMLSSLDWDNKISSITVDSTVANSIWNFIQTSQSLIAKV